MEFLCSWNLIIYHSDIFYIYTVFVLIFQSPFPSKNSWSLVLKIFVMLLSPHFLHSVFLFSFQNACWSNVRPPDVFFTQLKTTHKFRSGIAPVNSHLSSCLDTDTVNPLLILGTRNQNLFQVSKSCIFLFFLSFFKAVYFFCHLCQSGFLYHPLLSALKSQLHMGLSVQRKATHLCHSGKTA